MGAGGGVGGGGVGPAAAAGRGGCGSWWRRLATAALLLAAAALLLLYRLCYSAPESAACAVAGGRAAARVTYPPFEHTQRRLPTAVIIGVRKGGTRALLEMIDVHPQVMRASREVHFFDRDDNYRKGLKWYRKRMPYSLDDQITIEKSPSYFITPVVPARMYDMSPSVRLLLLVRDPVTRLISDYTQYREKWLIEGLPLTPLPDVVLNPDGTVRMESKLIKVSLYHRHLRRWLRYFPRESILLLDGDELIENPLPLLKKVEKHLGLPPYIDSNHLVFNETKGFYCVIKEQVSTEPKCLNASKGRKHPDVDPELISLLRRFFAPFNQRFYRLAQVNFSWPEE